ncbi:AGL323Cp [Eremothecium gossypii ATCC 10895]|uniref:ER lumen protein-retaining receptor n=1 Tax=Eremothecium gossypii (strain ATCC 10895 / CBS 109.51 / FGSC 9923 / NRRL Y-1056) TaxID=284811 RepID=Q751M0_EREGS|nr:AGL323Cp [Eremothecium gossypii ATCC 10895]AAS54168.1 AGL323Cp [Eremothecium gossypii ATCC 10895]AEY98494.1 FAGL323Cp [Eremothecium gossypii FDAG1]
MNPFRLLGDASHLASILVLISTIQRTQAIDGISLKTQVLYFVVFVTRYLDLFTKWRSLYNTLMKVFFISSSLYVIVQLKQARHKQVVGYQNMVMRDTFKIRYLVAASAALALITTRQYKVQQVLWVFSVWLESVAIMPQLFMLSKAGKADALTSHYIFALGFYRAMYIPNWIWRYYVENRFDKVAVVAGVVQTLIYSDFFYIYYRKVIREGANFELPV